MTTSRPFAAFLRGRLLPTALVMLAMFLATGLTVLGLLIKPANPRLGTAVATSGVGLVLILVARLPDAGKPRTRGLVWTGPERRGAPWRRM